MKLLSITLIAASSILLSACLPEESVPTPPTTWYADVDGDGYGDDSDAGTASTIQPADYVSNNLDCDDAAATINPDATEIENSVDDDCDGVVDEGYAFYFKDTDGDGYGNPSLTYDGKPDDIGAWSTTAGDCDDSDHSINPDGVEIANLKDDDCNGSTDEGFKYIFASSTGHRGDFTEGGTYSDGLTGADAFCQSLADSSNLPSGTYVAWLSSRTINASARVTSNASNTFSYIRPGDFQVIATSFPDLIDNTLAVSISTDENGNSASSNVWTNTFATGLKVWDNLTHTCENWTVEVNTVSGFFGLTANTDTWWTARANASCNAFNKVYCVQY